MPKKKKTINKSNSGENSIPPRFVTTVILVKDIAQSKFFYTSILGQKITMDFGANVVFENGLAIWEGNFAYNLIFGQKYPGQQLPYHSHEIYFEIDDIEAFFTKIKAAGVRFIHELITQPWQQRVFRFLDPDDHLVEIGEPMPAVVMRLAKEGLAISDIMAKKMMPEAVVATLIQGLSNKTPEKN
jgi:catechol 2,3-dioxygenase-like lactoylglutathione lyase family enzyme